MECCWTSTQNDAYAAVIYSLLQAPILALPVPSRSFSVVCDLSDDFAIGCALLQDDPDNNERVVAYESRELEAAEKNYTVHDKELLAMNYALVKFRSQLRCSKNFENHNDHAS